MYPVFKPNDYFWNHHWSKDCGLEKWQVYSKVIREEIMAKSFNFKLFDITSEEKMDFKAIMRGKAVKDWTALPEYD